MQNGRIGVLQEIPGSRINDPFESSTDKMGDLLADFARTPDRTHWRKVMTHASEHKKLLSDNGLEDMADTYGFMESQSDLFESVFEKHDIDCSMSSIQSFHNSLKTNIGRSKKLDKETINDIVHAYNVQKALGRLTVFIGGAKILKEVLSSSNDPREALNHADYAKRA
jgi:hypothetical protein